MMTRYGDWSPAGGHTIIYFLFAGMALMWLLSLANLPIAAAVLIARLARRYP
jgi:hypothetical protein